MQPQPTMSPEQAQHVAFYSPEQRAARTAAARDATDAAVTEAHRLFFDGDEDGAGHVLFLAGLTDEGISHYLGTWGSEYC